MGVAAVMLLVASDASRGSVGLLSPAGNAVAASAAWLLSVGSCGALRARLACRERRFDGTLNEMFCFIAFARSSARAENRQYEDKSETLGDWTCAARSCRRILAVYGDRAGHDPHGIRCRFAE